MRLVYILFHTWVLIERHRSSCARNYQSTYIYSGYFSVSDTRSTYGDTELIVELRGGELMTTEIVLYLVSHTYHCDKCDGLYDKYLRPVRSGRLQEVSLECRL